MPTALERYAEAFRLQKEGKKGDAVIAYREIIREFPESPEREYSIIQLEKLDADALNEKMAVEALSRKETEDKAGKAKVAAEEQKKREEEQAKREKEETLELQRREEERVKKEKEDALEQQRREEARARRKKEEEEEELKKEKEEEEEKERKRRKYWDDKKKKAAAYTREGNDGEDAEDRDEKEQVQWKRSHRRSRIIHRFSAIAVLALIFSAVSVLCISVLIAVILGQGRALEYQEAVQKAAVAAMSGDDRMLFQNVMEAKSADPGKNLPYLLMADYFMKKNQKDLAYKELRDCPQFDTEVKTYIEKVKNYSAAPKTP